MISTSDPSGLVPTMRIPAGLELLAVVVVELVAVAMPLGNLQASVALGRLAPGDQGGGLGPEPHRPPLVGHRALLVEQANDRMGGVLVELGGVRPGQPEGVSRVFRHGALHSQADAEKGDAVLPGVGHGVHLALDAAVAEPAGHEHAVDAVQQALGAFPLDGLAVHGADAHPRRCATPACSNAS